MTILMPLKAKYRTRSAASGGAYRARTGPRCCNDGCPSRYKKAKKEGHGLGRKGGK